MQQLISATIPIVFLAGAFLPIWPYSYFVLLRWVITGSCAFILYTKKSHGSLQYILFIVLLIFNPFFPVHLERSIWLIIDGLSIIPFVFVIVNMCTQRSSKKRSNA